MICHDITWVLLYAELLIPSNTPVINSNLVKLIVTGLA